MVPGKIFLSKHNRSTLAVQMSLGIPKSKILKNVSSSFNRKKIIKWVTNKDLENIKRDFKIENEAILHPDLLIPFHIC